MATISRRQSKKTGEVHYRVQIRLDGHPPQTRTFERKTDAKDWARAVEADLKARRHQGLPALERHTLAELVDRYVEEVLPGKPAVVALYGRHLAWWRKELGAIYLSDLSSDRIEGAYRQILREPGSTGRKRTPSTANRYLISLSACLAFGRKKLKWMSLNPASGVEREREPRGRVRFLSRPVDVEDSELERLLNACKASRNPDLYDLAVLGIWTGCREGELMALAKSQLRLTEGGFMLSAEDTKGKRERFVALVGPALEIVERRVKNPGEYLFEGLVRKNSTKIPAFPRRAWNTAVRTAGITNFKFHDLRHTHASYLAMAGGTERELMESLGHRTASMVNRYAHLAHEHKRAVATRFDATVGGWSRAGG
ncbi:MAG TPA: site-specific integrase [Thermoanaerobaculia bacterium]|jgi:integrase|nr:site-specific integrase [Thermoanaerobaculia bacterium]